VGRGGTTRLFVGVVGLVIRDYGEPLALPFAGFGPVRQQLLTVLRAINRKRRKAGFELVPVTALRLSRRSLKVFVEGAEESLEAA
jgi:hypothetical protein